MGIRALGLGEGSYMEWSVKPYSSSCWLEGFRSASCRSGFWSMLISELGWGRETLLVSVTELDKIMSVTGPACRPHWLHTAYLIRALTSISTCSYQNIVFSTLVSVNKTRTSGKHCFPGRALWTTLGFPWPGTLWSWSKESSVPSLSAVLFPEAVLHSLEKPY